MNYWLYYWLVGFFGMLAPSPLVYNSVSEKPIKILVNSSLEEGIGPWFFGESYSQALTSSNKCSNLAQNTADPVNSEIHSSTLMISNLKCFVFLEALELPIEIILNFYQERLISFSAEIENQEKEQEVILAWVSKMGQDWSIEHFGSGKICDKPPINGSIESLPSRIKKITKGEAWVVQKKLPRGKISITFSKDNIEFVYGPDGSFV